MTKSSPKRRVGDPSGFRDMSGKTISETPQNATEISEIKYRRHRGAVALRDSRNGDDRRAEDVQEVRKGENSMTRNVVEVKRDERRRRAGTTEVGVEDRQFRHAVGKKEDRHRSNRGRNGRDLRSRDATTGDAKIESRSAPLGFPKEKRATRSKPTGESKERDERGRVEPERKALKKRDEIRRIEKSDQKKRNILQEVFFKKTSKTDGGNQYVVGKPLSEHDDQILIADEHEQGGEIRFNEDIISLDISSVCNCRACQSKRGNQPVERSEQKEGSENLIRSSLKRDKEDSGKSSVSKQDDDTMVMEINIGCKSTSMKIELPGYESKVSGTSYFDACREAVSFLTHALEKVKKTM